MALSCKFFRKNSNSAAIPPFPPALPLLRTAVPPLGDSNLSLGGAEVGVMGGWVVGWLVGWLAGWLVGWLVIGPIVSLKLFPNGLRGSACVRRELAARVGRELVVRICFSFLFSFLEKMARERMDEANRACHRSWFPLG